VLLIDLFKFLIEYLHFLFCVGWIEIFRSFAEEFGPLYGFALLVQYYTPGIYGLSAFLALKKHPHPIIGRALAGTKLVLVIYAYIAWPSMVWGPNPPAGRDMDVLVREVHSPLSFAIFVAQIIIAITCLRLNTRALRRIKESSVSAVQA